MGASVPIFRLYLQHGTGMGIIRTFSKQLSGIYHLTASFRSSRSFPAKYRELFSMGNPCRCNIRELPGWKYQLFYRAVRSQTMDQKNRNKSATHCIQVRTICCGIILVTCYRRSYSNCSGDLPLTHGSHFFVYDCREVFAVPGFGSKFLVLELRCVGLLFFQLLRTP